MIHLIGVLAPVRWSISKTIDQLKADVPALEAYEFQRN